MERVQKILNQKPSRWANLTVKEFERDIEVLQTTCKQLMIQNEYLKKVKAENQQLKKEKASLELSLLNKSYIKKNKNEK